MPLTLAFAYIISLGVAAVIPGPGVAALVGRALGTGLKRTIPMLMGVILGDIFYLTLAVIGLAYLAANNIHLILIIKIIGSLYLLYLAIVFWNSGINIQKIDKSKGRRDGIASMLAGLMLTMGNPKTIIFYLAILPAVIDLKTVNVVNYFGLVILTFVVLFIALMPYIYLASKAREIFQNTTAIKRLNQSASIIIGSAAIWILLMALF